jgi:hypothetical protein
VSYWAKGTSGGVRWAGVGGVIWQQDAVALSVIINDGPS